MNKSKIIKGILIGLVALVVVAAVSAAGFFYMKYQKIKNNPEIVTKEEVKAVTESIQKFMDLPSDEEPTLATVTDQEKVKDQEFFKRAQNGDKILLYQQARKAILYRPSTGRIIEFAPLAIGAPGAEPNQQGSQAPAAEPVTVAIYNGTTTVGLTAEVEDQLKDIAGIKVTQKENAQKNEYTQTVVADLSGGNEALVSRIAQQLGGSVGKLPDDEKKPNADILIIAAK